MLELTQIVMLDFEAEQFISEHDNSHTETYTFNVV